MTLSIRSFLLNYVEPKEGLKLLEEIYKRIFDPKSGGEKRKHYLDLKYNTTREEPAKTRSSLEIILGKCYAGSIF
jgi:hypothetical protein